jgi:hypothetical protein
MKNKVTVTWLSPSEKMSNPTFVAERLAKLESMLVDKTLIDNPKDQDYASIVFNNESQASEWAVFIAELAAKYNKQIVNITIE